LTKTLSLAKTYDAYEKSSSK